MCGKAFEVASYGWLHTDWDGLVMHDNCPVVQSLSIESINFHWLQSEVITACVCWPRHNARSQRAASTGAKETLPPFLPVHTHHQSRQGLAQTESSLDRCLLLYQQLNIWCGANSTYEKLITQIATCTCIPGCRHSETCTGHVLMFLGISLTPWRNAILYTSKQAGQSWPNMDQHTLSREMENMVWLKLHYQSQWTLHACATM